MREVAFLPFVATTMAVEVAVLLVPRGIASTACSAAFASALAFPATISSPTLLAGTSALALEPLPRLYPCLQW